MRQFAIGLIWIVANSGGVLGVSAAQAQSAPKPSAHEKPLADVLQGPAKQAYASARLLFRNGDFSGAAAKFQQAYDLSKDARLLYDMAICEKNLRAYARMQGLLEQYSRESGPEISAEHKAAVDDAIAAIRDLVGTVTVESHDEGATVSVDGDAVGTTPLSAPIVLDLGKHRIDIKKPGYEVVTREVQIAGGTAEVISANLEKIVTTGRLVIGAEPETTISIDGRVVAKGRFDGPLAAGPHDVQVTELGKIPYRTDVELHERETRTLDVTLTSEAKPGAPLWPWIVGGVAVAAGAAVGGYFLFKPSDTTTPVPGGMESIAVVKLSGFGGR